MTAFRLLIVLFSILSVSIFRCSDEENEVPPEVVDENAIITIDSNNFLLYFDVEVILQDRPGTSYPNPFTYTIQFMTRQGVIIESPVGMDIDILFDVEYNYYDQIKNIIVTDHIDYLWSAAHLSLEPHQDTSDILLKYGYPSIPANIPNLYNIPSISYDYTLVYAHGEVSLDNNYYPPNS